MTIARELSDRHSESETLNTLGSAYGLLGEAQRAIELSEQALIMARELGDRRIEGMALNTLGRAYAMLDAPQRALQLHEQALTIAQQIDDRSGEATASWELGVLLERQGDLSRAAELLPIRVDFERELDHPDTAEHAAHLEQVRQQLKEALQGRLLRHSVAYILPRLCSIRSEGLRIPRPEVDPTLMRAYQKPADERHETQ